MPFVRGSVVGSEKIIEENKKKNKFAMTQKISTHSWRQTMPKKTFLDKIVEQVPERW